MRFSSFFPTRRIAAVFTGAMVLVGGAALAAAPAKPAWLLTFNVSAVGGHIIGNPAAPTKLVEYASYTCGHCGTFETTEAPMLKSQYIANGKVSFEIRNFVRDEMDLTAARISRCGADEAMYPLTEQFMAFQPTMFENLKKVEGDAALNAKLSSLKGADRAFAVGEAAGIIDFFAQRGVSRDQAKACLSDQKEMDKLAEMTSDYGKKYDIKGTPTFYLNGNKIDVTAWPAVNGKLMEAGAR